MVHMNIAWTNMLFDIAWWNYVLESLQTLLYTQYNPINQCLYKHYLYHASICKTCIVYVCLISNCDDLNLLCMHHFTGYLP